MDPGLDKTGPLRSSATGDVVCVDKETIGRIAFMMRVQDAEPHVFHAHNTSLLYVSAKHPTRIPQEHQFHRRRLLDWRDCVCQSGWSERET